MFINSHINTPPEPLRKSFSNEHLRTSKSSSLFALLSFSHSCFSLTSHWKSARKSTERYSARNPRLDPNPSSDFPTLDPFPPPASPSHIMTSAIGKSNMCSDLVLHPPAFSGHSHGNEKKNNTNDTKLSQV